MKLSINEEERWKNRGITLRQLFATTFLKSSVGGVMVILALAVSFPLRAAQISSEEIAIHETPSGIRFGTLGAKPSSPAPTLFMFAEAIEPTLRRPDFQQVENALGAHGYRFVTLDLPCHGRDAKAGEPKDALSCWWTRLAKGDNFVPSFTRDLSSVLDYLVREQYTDPLRVAACGASRGGFIALHFAAADPRVKWVLAFSPVTNLVALSEFTGTADDPTSLTMSIITSLSLASNARKLVGRAIWLAIGSYDLRVNTDYTIAFSRRVVEASIAEGKAPDVELHVLPSNDHAVPAGAAANATAWLLARMNAK